ncbi:unnamed protein product [Spirodela intermedia]|uniref:non-specific serine/threonine protein kinase n=1 Tax=Spirodela intermedia TaxID=51605 RepID=A0A7I8KTE9_SPIIN|nr:unnamed protein product [Spirodela intermedia]
MPQISRYHGRRRWRREFSREEVVRSRLLLEARGRFHHVSNSVAMSVDNNSDGSWGLAEYAEWTIHLRKLNLGVPFAQGAFGKLYKGAYNGEAVAVKLLERPDNNPERAQLMEQQFVREVMMLATLRLANVVWFIGACRKPMVWCTVKEYAEGGSDRQFLTRRRNHSAALKLAVKQALDVARGMALDWNISLDGSVSEVPSSTCKVNPLSRIQYLEITCQHC